MNNADFKAKQNWQRSSYISLSSSLSLFPLSSWPFCNFMLSEAGFASCNCVHYQLMKEPYTTRTKLCALCGSASGRTGVNHFDSCPHLPSLRQLTQEEQDNLLSMLRTVGEWVISLRFHCLTISSCDLNKMGSTKTTWLKTAVSERFTLDWSTKTTKTARRMWIWCCIWTSWKTWRTRSWRTSTFSWGYLLKFYL